MGSAGDQKSLVNLRVFLGKTVLKQKNQGKEAQGSDFLPEKSLLSHSSGSKVTFGDTLGRPF